MFALTYGNALSSYKCQKDKALTSYCERSNVSWKMFPLTISSLKCTPTSSVLHSILLWCQQCTRKPFGTRYSAAISFMMIMSLRNYSLRGYTARFNIAGPHSGGWRILLWSMILHIKQVSWPVCSKDHFCQTLYSPESSRSNSLKTLINIGVHDSRE